MNEHVKKITIRNVSIFAIIVLTSGWIGKVIDLMMGVQSYEIESLGMLIWLIAPIVCSIALRFFGGDGWKDIGFKPYLKKNIRWYIVSSLVFPILTTFVIFIGSALGWISFDTSQFEIYIQAFIVALIPNFLKNIPEEFAWQGYLTPKLRYLIKNDFILYIGVGLIWGLWHAPYYIYFLTDATINSITGLSRFTFILVATITMIAWSIPFIELRLLTKSVWPCVLMHMVEDAFLNPLILVGFIKISRSKELFISPIYGLISIALYITLGLILRKVRINRDKAIQSSEENPIISGSNIT
ncbi:CAAX amino terminal protease family protein [Gottschalkia acidurici 9a]|uniref:CAAX amino terminal protease family protein n=1 Tax=Gottschalkia acidurici (strain ATCC 7906 / DSM 604 / BCRC 14475 / CIP 104303 / KCTC 5404 / NCIMB 10678 / 9a) TaxID=1128398 RepID=K0AYL9_GOTA9|nr:CPBP family intramembrane glutamic endopeptidase [Gottschalkia acidurici]AFS77830.1 CAAX amino terminal protease family protein [Gottschalkia acidurici 9a]